MRISTKALVEAWEDYKEEVERFIEKKIEIFIPGPGLDRYIYTTGEDKEDILVRGTNKKLYQWLIRRGVPGLRKIYFKREKGGENELEKA